MSAVDAVRRRRSHSKVTPVAPSHQQLLEFVSVLGSVADHGSLRPWRLIEVRGGARVRLGAAFVEASGLGGEDAAKLAQKPLRASLLIAIVARVQPSFKVPAWEQEAVASGIAHTLSLLLDEAGWGVLWRSGGLTRSEAVHRMHELAPDEHLLGWLYVGGVEKVSIKERKPLEAARYLSELA